MWRIVVPLLEFAVYCVLSLAVFSLISVLLCGVWEGEDRRRHKHSESFMV